MAVTFQWAHAVFLTMSPFYVCHGYVSRNMHMYIYIFIYKSFYSLYKPISDDSLLFLAFWISYHQSSQNNNQNKMTWALKKASLFLLEAWCQGHRSWERSLTRLSYYYHKINYKTTWLAMEYIMPAMLSCVQPLCVITSLVYRLGKKCGFVLLWFNFISFLFKII